jgi:hypothetical protein
MLHNRMTENLGLSEKCINCLSELTIMIELDTATY